MPPIISIIIPTHKRPAILLQCLEHLERQTIRDQVEVIVVSDGHDPETALLFTATGYRLQATGYYEIEKSQQGMARNRGVQEAKGEYVLFIGDDIFLAADACEKHVKSLTAHSSQLTAILGHTTWDPAVDITPVMTWLEKNGWQFGYPMLKSYAHAFIPKEIQHRFTYTSHISLPTAIARAHPFQRTDLYGWEDIEWGKRLADMNVRLFYEVDAKAWHHHHLTLEDSLKRMETLGESAALMAKRDPSFDRIPHGMKFVAYHLLSMLPTLHGKHARAFLRGVRGAQ